MQQFRQIYSNLRQTHETNILAFDPLTMLNPAPLTWWQMVVQNHGTDPPTRPLYAPELIYCYWLEEGGLVQAMEMIARRFQNQRVSDDNPLARLDISPLRQISDLLWAFIDDQHRRLGIQRRGLEYLHCYGLRLEGRAVGNLQPADSRSAFLRAFHTLLNTCYRFFDQVDDRTVNSRPSPVLACLKELQLVLSQGESNQFGTVPVQARVEMSLIQELLNSQEIGRFLGGPSMGRYPAPWLERLDTLRRLMRWGSASMVEFWNLARSGEQILMTARFGAFHAGQTNPLVADQWANSLRNEIEQYVHSYRAVTGVDLGAKLVSGQSVDATQPSVYLRRNETRHRASA